MNLRSAAPAECTHDRLPAFIYDANGAGQWCIDCGAELRSPGSSSSWVILWLFVPGIVIVLLALLGMICTVSSPLESPRVVPTTYGYPPAGTMGP